MLIRLLAILMLTLIPSAQSYGQGDEVPREYQVKAKYLLNIPRYTEMLLKTQDTSFYTICLIGDTPMESLLVSAKGKLIKNIPLAVRRIENISQADGCQMLFIASSQRNRLQKLLPEAHRLGILTISDMPDFARMGGIISLQTVENRVIFDLNLTAASNSSITFSSHLLKLARDIIN